MNEVIFVGKSFTLGVCNCGCKQPIAIRSKHRKEIARYAFRHRHKIRDKRICFNCGTDKTHMTKEGWQQWRQMNRKWYCSKCAFKLYIYPKTGPIRQVKRVNYKGKRLPVKENPRKGRCQNLLCTNLDYKRTEIHHKKYHDDDILKDTIEVCSLCHSKTKKRLRRLILS